MHIRRRGVAIGRATDLQFTGRGFESWLAPWASYLQLSASVT